MLFDADVLIWLLRGNERAIAEVDACAERRASIVTLMELLQGARNRRESGSIRNLLGELGVHVVPITAEVGSLAAAIIEEHALAHGIQVVDAMVAATSLHHGWPLCSGNAKHYRPVKGLELKLFRP